MKRDEITVGTHIRLKEATPVHRTIFGVHTSGHSTTVMLEAPDGMVGSLLLQDILDDWEVEE